MIVLIVLPLASATPARPVEPERHVVIGEHHLDDLRDRDVDKLHVMAERVWADRCREDER